MHTNQINHQYECDLHSITFYSHENINSFQYQR